MFSALFVKLQIWTVCRGLSHTLSIQKSVLNIALTLCVFFNPCACSTLLFPALPPSSHSDTRRGQYRSVSHQPGADVAEGPEAAACYQVSRLGRQPGCAGSESFLLLNAEETVISVVINTKTHTILWWRGTLLCASLLLKGIDCLRSTSKQPSVPSEQAGKWLRTGSRQKHPMALCLSRTSLQRSTHQPSVASSWPVTTTPSTTSRSGTAGSSKVPRTLLFPALWCWSWHGPWMKNWKLRR